MTCKDCIHYLICQRFTELGYSITEERKDLEVHCKFFAEQPRWHYELPAEDKRDTLLLVASGSSMIGEERFTLKKRHCPWLLHGERYMVPRRLSGN